MNKIVLFNDKVKDITVDDNIEYYIINKNDIFDVTSLKLVIKNNTSLEIDYESDVDIKLDVCIDVLDNVSFNLFEKRVGLKTKILYKYNLNKDSYMKIDKFYDVFEMKEADLINLNGKNASIDYNLKTISKNKEKYDIRVNHNYPNTFSNIKNNGVNIKDGELTFNVSSFVFKNKVDCTVNQTNRIINLTNNKCKINPNLFIDENLVTANHSAHIGTFSNEEMFYLQSRGIDNLSATYLLIKGFLLSEFNLSDNQTLEVTEIINKYWR